MASTYSFDVVSEIDMQEVDNAINQAMKEIKQRYDFKGTKTEINLVKDEVKIISDDEFKLNSVIDILQGKLIKRGISSKALEIGKIDSGSLGTAKVDCKLIKGIATDKAKKMVADIKATKMKIQAQIMDNQLRISGKDKDDLQAVMQLLKSKDYGIALQFTNYR
ncbi:MAG: YajQ family cyclic di-GMP-binding protein [Clostridium sp.]|uniref:YajQ family cyclic di-GMP-binding protein n=1 Tax=Clostridium culturomicium TaxID=1499683 RepID=UPI00058F72EF|nr:YajQ family cyclic di-GMP-binding protein [Clostridium culturomicium]MDU4891834.1 YajQ family cyclic di-GMP-binding protein [Clostridium sp.]MDU7084831.1 YajQ family cyclic di-GMP-binding protein [Clostridium sp.]